MSTEERERDNPEEEKPPVSFTDIPTTGSIESVRLDSAVRPPTGQQVVIGPVPLDVHYNIFKSVEDGVKARLGELEHEYYLTGLRVAYDEMDSPSEPGVFPYSVEFGYLEWLDQTLQCAERRDISEDELKRQTQLSPIPIDLLDQLFDDAEGALEEAVGKDLRVGVFIALAGSGHRGAAATCNCANGANRQRLDSVWLNASRVNGSVCRNRECHRRRQS
jgi:hypothetical protein